METLQLFFACVEKQRFFYHYVTGFHIIRPPHNNVAYLGSFAKVSVPVYSITP